MQTISKKAPRLFIWVCNGKKGKDENLLMLPAGLGKLGYVTKLIEDCKKYEEIGTPVIFAYSGKTLKEGQKKSIQRLANFIPNLFVFDFNKFIEQLIDPEAPQFLRDFLQEIKDRTKECTNRILENKPDAPIIFSEFMRFITLYYNNEVREFLKTQYNIEKFKLLEAKGMIYGF